MRGTLLSRLRSGATKLIRDQGGNAMMLTAAAVVPLIGIVGSAVDIGRGYMAQLRLQQACDAGVLAGRRAMAGGVYDDPAKAEATKMFNFNYPQSLYGSTSVNFSSSPLGTADVQGAATATLPTAIMHIMGTDQFNLSASCAAKLEISNTDMMLVLDVTGSMDENTSDGKKRIVAMKDAAKLFFDTMTSATAVGDGRLRFGMVPYASTVNVGEILRTKNSAWISDYTLLPSRSAITKLTWSGSGTAVPTAINAATNKTTYSDWANVLPVSGFTTSGSCSGLTPPADTTPTTAGAPDMNKTARWADSADKRIYSNDTATVHNYYNYRYNYSSMDDRCWLQRRLVTYTQTNAATVNATATFRDRYRYEDRLFDVSSAKTGSKLYVDVGDGGANKEVAWSGCIIERRTAPFGSSTTAPTSALDMDVDSAPTSDEATKWQVYIPEITHMRAMSRSYITPLYSNNTTRGIVDVDGKALVVDKNKVSAAGTSDGNWVTFAEYAGSGYGVCPPAAKNMTEMTATDKSTFYGWIDGLSALGGTYHDIGLLWGIRLMSPVGLFATENTTVKNERPIQRHIIFMTDGQMSANMSNFSAQGYEYLMQRVSGSADMSDSDLTARHSNRFNQLCEIAKDEKHNITIWVIGFGTNLSDNLLACASPGNGASGRKAYQTSSAAELKSIFQSIASQISRLRLSE